MAEPEKIGKYVIQGVLGKGAMGVVYKAFDPHIERVVAIKTVRKDLVDPDLAVQVMARFQNEAKAAGRLLHPNIVSVYEYAEDEINAFIAMEYVEGTGLREYLNRKASFDLGQIVAIVSQLLLALDFAHERGVVHRDVKPANLILTSGGTLKVADFGIARIDTSNLTNAGMVMGTPSYMSPEQCQGKEVDRRSDVFSTGVVLYELLTGEKPFSGSIEAIAFKICYEEPRPPSEISKLVLSPALDAIVATALAKDPGTRFQNAKPSTVRCDSRSIRRSVSSARHKTRRRSILPRSSCRLRRPPFGTTRRCTPSSVNSPTSLGRWHG
jgi:serine/threonine protein kinase